MTSAVCTLFEGNHHFGVAALVNSLYRNGYRGDFYAGYRGDLPPWANSLKSLPADAGAGSKYLVAPGLIIQFLPLDTSNHLANYKPNFILELFHLVPNIEAIVYFDPDITVTTQWSNVDSWLSCGVALCEDVNSPLSQNHPRRTAWRRYFAPRNICLTFKDVNYVNSGFIGVTRKHRVFVELWKTIQEALVDEIGSLSATTIPGAFFETAKKDDMYPFNRPDQDACNCAVGAFAGEVSIVGSEAMGFKPGTTLFPHAIGSPKPWNFSLFSSIANARSPRLAEVKYWQEVRGPICPHSIMKVTQKKIELRLAAAVGRFYHRA